MHQDTFEAMSLVLLVGGFERALPLDARVVIEQSRHDAGAQCISTPICDSSLEPDACDIRR